MHHSLRQKLNRRRIFKPPAFSSAKAVADMSLELGEVTERLRRLTSRQNRSIAQWSMPEKDSDEQSQLAKYVSISNADYTSDSSEVSIAKNGTLLEINVSDKPTTHCKPQSNSYLAIDAESTAPIVKTTCNPQEKGYIQ